MFRNFSSTKATTWQDKLADLAKFREKIAKYSSAAPQLRPVLEAEFQEEKAHIAGYVMNGVIQQQAEKIAKYQKTARKFHDARMREMVRWDLPRVHSEKQAVEGMIEGIRRGHSEDKYQALRDLYEELTAEGQPMERRRAAVEVFGGVVEMHWEGETRQGEPLRYRVNDLARAAKELEPQLRVTNEMLELDTELQAAKAELVEAHEQIADVGVTIGEGGFAERSRTYHPGDPEDRGLMAVGPLGEAWRRVQYNNGQLVVLPESEDKA